VNKPSRRWQAAAGYVSDLYRFARARLENPHSYLKFLRLNELRKKVNADACIETGTYLGVTSYRCSFVFQLVYTIELEPELAHAAKRFLKRRRNVQVIRGDALQELGKIFENNQFARAVVFLDGHHTGPQTACGEIPEPALEELDVLKNYKTRVAAIVIDDFRNFGEEKGFPRKSQLLQTAEQLFPEYRLSVSLDQVCLVASSASE